MSMPRVFGWFYSVRGETLHYFQHGHSLCRRVSYSVRAIEPRIGHEKARVCQFCAAHAQNKPQAMDPDQARLFR